MEYQRFTLGPHETEEMLQKRIERLETLNNNPPKTPLTDGDWDGARERLKELYGVDPDWIVAYFGNERLTFYQAAATWIIEEEGCRIPLIQLKTRYADLPKGCTEILAHEAVHAVRMQFDEPWYEEIFAYQTSQYGFRRWFGPLFLHLWEAPAFIVLSMAPLLGIFHPLFFWLPWGFLALLLMRLAALRLILKLAFLRFVKLGLKKSECWAFAFRLSDREIFSFAFNKAVQINSPHMKALKKLYRSFKFK